MRARKEFLVLSLSKDEGELTRLGQAMGRHHMPRGIQRAQ